MLLRNIDCYLNDGDKINLDKLFIYFLFFSLLSNAGLPETNPLLLDEDLDQTVGEDFQKMLNEWENHIGSLQVIDSFSHNILKLTFPACF